MKRYVVYKKSNRLGWISCYNSRRTGTEAQQIRAFISEGTSGRKQKLGDDELGGREWIEWDKGQADRFDPTVESPSSILDERVESEQCWRY